MRSISSGSRPVSRATSSTVTCSSGPREEVLGEAEGEPALAARLLQLLERVAALAHPRHHPRLRRGGRGPATAPHRDHLLGGPALERGRRRPPSGERPRSGICALRPPSRHTSFALAGGAGGSTYAVPDATFSQLARWPPPPCQARLRPTAPIAADAVLVGDPGRALLLAQELLEQRRR